MNGLRQILAVIFYLIWIPLGILILAVIVFLITANPLGGLLELLQAGGAGGGSPGSPASTRGEPAGGFPSQEQIQQFQQFQQQGPESGKSKDFVPGEGGTIIHPPSPSD